MKIQADDWPALEAVAGHGYHTDLDEARRQEVLRDLSVRHREVVERLFEVQSQPLPVKLRVVPTDE